MGFFKKLFGGDAGISEAMYETYSNVKFMHPSLEEHEILSLVLHYRYKKLLPEIGLLIAVLFPRINILTEWVIGLENSGGPKYLDEYLAQTTTLEDREKALSYIQNMALSKGGQKVSKRESISKNIVVSEKIVDKSAEVLWQKFHDKLNYSFDPDSKPLDHLSNELRNTVANIYYRYIRFCEDNPTDCVDYEKRIKEIKKEVESQIDSFEMALEAIIELNLKGFPNTIVGEYAATNHAMEWLADNYGKLPSELFRLADDILIAVFKYRIEDAYSRTGASLVAECKIREDESDEIPDLMNYFEYSWGCHFDNPYTSTDKTQA